MEEEKEKRESEQNVVALLLVLITWANKAYANLPQVNIQSIAMPWVHSRILHIC